MASWQDVYGSVLKRVLAEHQDAQICVVGCWAKGINHPVCELDLIIISPNRGGFERRIEGDLIIDVRYVDSEQVACRLDDVLASSLTECRILQDPELRLASLVESLKKRTQKIRRKLAASALINALSYLGLGKRALKEEYNMSGCFWLLASGYNLLEVLIWAAGDTPRPSHLMKQFRAYCGAYSQTVGSLLGLAEATTTAVKRRLDFLSRCYEAEALGLLRQCKLEELLPTLAARKTFFLLDANMVVDAYLYLGYLVVEVLRRFYESESEFLLKTKPYRFVDDIEDRSILGKGVVKLASFTNIDRIVIQDVDEVITKLAQNI
jgi:hypothetical protein